MPMRHAVVNGQSVNEIRAGFTIAFNVEGKKMDTKRDLKPGVTFANWGLSC
jgi:hypothetical protein